MPDSSMGDPLGCLDELCYALESPELYFLVDALHPFSRTLRTSLSPPDGAGSGAKPSADDLSDLDLFELKHFFHDESGWELLKQVSRSEGLSQAAYSVLRYLGYCRLYGVSLPEDVDRRITGALLLYLSVPASMELIRRIKIGISLARELPERFDEAEPFEDMSFCTSVLHLLMQFWATTLALEEGYRFYLAKTNDIESKLGHQIDHVLVTISSLDSILQQEEHIRLLSVATSLPLLENWRLMLAEPFKGYLPWWLDGCLEEAAETTEGDISIPSPFGRSNRRDKPELRPLLRAQRRPRLMESPLHEYLHRPEVAVAAAPGLSERDREKLDEIQSIEYDVESDASIRFHLGLNVDETGRPRSLGLWLTPANQAADWEATAERFDRARLHVPGAPNPFEVGLRRANGIFPLSGNLADNIEDWIGDLEIELVDTQGNLFRVILD